MWPYVLIKHAVQIIKQRSNCKTSSHATSVHKFEAWNQNEGKRKKKKVDFDKFLDIYFVYLGTKDMYSIFLWHAVKSLFHFQQNAV